jgi:hypothetical protein
VNAAAAVALIAVGCYVAAVALLVAIFGPRLDDARAELDVDEPIDLVPADDLMGVADAVQDAEPPVFVDEYLGARVVQAREIENKWVES